jgi:hypothetical protein
MSDCLEEYAFYGTCLTEDPEKIRLAAMKWILIMSPEDFQNRLLHNALPEFEREVLTKEIEERLCNRRKIIQEYLGKDKMSEFKIHMYRADLQFLSYDIFKNIYLGK